jgi:hypothetical protein
VGRFLRGFLQPQPHHTLNPNSGLSMVEKFAKISYVLAMLGLRHVFSIFVKNLPSP